MTAESRTVGDPLPPQYRPIEVRVAELKQLFNEMDPAPFREKDLDPNAEAFIVEWSRELPSNAPLCLIVHLDRPAGLPDEPSVLRDAIHEFFRQRAEVTRRRLRQLLRNGRTSLLIGLAFLTVSLVVGDLVDTMLVNRGFEFGSLVRESLLIGGWVAMWRPLEVFLYDWWPIREEARLHDRLSQMAVRIHYTGASDEQEAWRHDWPVAERGMPRSPRSVEQVATNL
jgi:hypothetical protein